MRILICATRMSLGGAETHVLTLTRELLRQGHFVVVASAGGALVPALSACGARHVTLPLDRKDPLSFVRCLRGLRRLTARERVQVIHAHGRIPAFVCSVLSRKPGAPLFVTTVHGLYDPEIPLGRLSRWGAHTLAVSEDVREHLTGVYGLDPARVTVIPNGVEIPAEQPPREEPGRIRLLTACRLDPDASAAVLHAIGLLPELSKRFPDILFTLTAAGEGSDAERVRAAAERVNAGLGREAVTLTGGRTELSPLYREADIFIGCSRSAEEAMVRGLPVVLLSGEECAGICTEALLAEAIGSNFVCRGGRLPRADLTEAVCELIAGGAEKRRAVGAEGRNFIASRCDIVDTAALTAGVMARLRREARPGVMLCGYFGAANAGDDASLAAVCSLLEEIAPGRRRTVICRRGRHGLNTEDLRGLGRLDVPGILREMRRTELFVLCGGSLLQNSTSTRSLRYYTFLTRSARRMGCRVMIWGGGAGPLKGRTARRLAGRALGACDAAGLRDRASFELLSSLGTMPEISYVSADPVMERAGSVMRLLPPGQEQFGVSVRPLRRLYGRRREAQIMDAILRAVKETAERTGLGVLWLPLAPEDEELCRRLCETSGLGEVAQRLDAENALTVTVGLRFVLGVRLHAGVFASAAGRAAVCAEYDPKVGAFAAAAGQLSVPLTERDPEKLAEALTGACLKAAAAENDRAARAAVWNSAARLRQAGLKDRETAERLLK